MNKKALAMLVAMTTAMSALAVCGWPYDPHKTQTGGTMTSCSPTPDAYGHSSTRFYITCSPELWADGGCSTGTVNPNRCYYYMGKKTVPHYTGWSDYTETAHNGGVYSNPRCITQGTDVLWLKVGYGGGACNLVATEEAATSTGTAAAPAPNPGP